MRTMNRSMLEARIVVLALLKQMASAGYTYLEVDDGGDADEIQRGLTIEQAMDAVFAVGEAHIFFSIMDCHAKGWVFIVPSNGADAVSDWGISPKPAMAKFNAVLEAFDGAAIVEAAMKSPGKGFMHSARRAVEALAARKLRWMSPCNSLVILDYHLARARWLKAQREATAMLAASMGVVS